MRIVWGLFSLVGPTLHDLSLSCIRRSNWTHIDEESSGIMSRTIKPTTSARRQPEPSKSRTEGVSNSARDQHKAAIAQRIEEQRRQREQQKRQQQIKQRITWAIGAVAAILVVALIVKVISASGGTTQKQANIAGVVTYSNLARTHTSGPLTYPQVPPVGGAHNPVWLNCGIYTQTIPSENAVHSMEHGAVWITYQPDLPAKDITQLQNLVRGHSYVILSPFPSLPGPVYASAWGVQLKATNAYDARLAQFITNYEQSPQAPEPGAACTGGVGTPTA